MLCYGAPIFLLLTRFGFANWLTATIVGVLPGIGSFLFWHNILSLPMTLCGFLIALIFFGLMQRFKPDPDIQDEVCSEPGEPDP
jgi:hypothetical protein